MTAVGESVDVLAAQVREALCSNGGMTMLNGHPTRYGRGVAALDALGARVTEAERERDETARNYSDMLNRVIEARDNWHAAYHAERARTADARNALEGIVRMEQASDQGWRAVYKHAQAVAREVLARLEGSSGDEVNAKRCSDPFLASSPRR